MTGIQPLRANPGDRHSFAADPALVMDDWFLSVSRRGQESSPMPAPAPKQGAESRHWLALQFATSSAAQESGPLSAEPLTIETEAGTRPTTQTP